MDKLLNLLEKDARLTPAQIAVMTQRDEGDIKNAIKEYEKKHPEFIFLKAMDMFVEGDSEIIEKDDPFYKLVDDGFVKLNIDLLNNLL